eukprot:NODE_6389_length_1676_cov_6.568754.p1 GENE.NODE_6389_length_1676_cov_6.568754~~NODE_6389_length_1676_cov_6.568754.p1  ORF type:complete len:355 (-),score=103.79 NODE_6389_length_1676_cov_6.568754:610-1569(-)
MRQLECIDVPAAVVDGAREMLSISWGVQQRLSLWGRPGKSKWVADVHENGEAQKGKEGKDRNEWSNGAVWTQLPGQESQVLGMLSAQTVASVKEWAERLLTITQDDGGIQSIDPTRWPARLVPLCTEPTDYNSSLNPFDLVSVEAQIATFKYQLTEDDAEVSDGSEAAASEASSGEEDEDVVVDTSQEAISEEYMWRLAQDPVWPAQQSRDVVFVESALALPPTPICAECEKEGQSFSKSQLSRHPDDRKCTACVELNKNEIYKPATGPGGGVAPPEQTTCSVCKVLLVVKKNCTASQRQKAPSRRRCNACLEKANGPA